MIRVGRKTACPSPRRLALAPGAHPLAQSALLSGAPSGFTEPHEDVAHQRESAVKATVVDTRGLVEEERADAWVGVMVMAQVTQRTRLLDKAAFRGRLTVMPLEAGQITHLSHASVLVQRTPGFIRRSDPEMYHAALAVHGEVGIEQCRQNSLLHPRDVGFFDSSQPFETFTGSAPARTVIFQFPENLLRVPERHFAGSRDAPYPRRKVWAAFRPRSWRRPSISTVPVRHGTRRSCLQRSSTS